MAQSLFQAKNNLRANNHVIRCFEAKRMDRTVQNAPGGAHRHGPEEQLVRLWHGLLGSLVLVLGALTSTQLRDLAESVEVVLYVAPRSLKQ